jgi:hypothetical protein
VTQQKHPKVGTVYLLWAEDTDRFKIGYTYAGVGKRAAAIETCSPWPIRIVATMPGRVYDEKTLQLEFMRFRTHREWFALPETDVWRLLDRFGVEAPAGAAIGVA